MKTKVTHCKNCPMSIYRDFPFYEAYRCKHPKFVDTPIYVLTTDHLDIEGVDDKPLPSDCPLRDGDLVIGI